MNKSFLRSHFPLQMFNLLVKIHDREIGISKIRKYFEENTDNDIAMSYPKLNQLISQLEDEGIVIKKPWVGENNKKDRRKKIIVITPKGRDLREKLEGYWKILLKEYPVEDLRTD